MAKDIINPKDTTSMLQVNEAINLIKTEVGFIREAGVFDESYSRRDTFLEEVKANEKRGMLPVTSRRERNKVKHTKRKAKQFSVQMWYQESIEEVTQEDVYQVAASWEDASEEDIMQLYIDKMTIQRETIDNSHDYMMWTAAQGITRNPEDGSVILDVFAQTGIARPQVTLDLTDLNLNILTWMAEFRNRVARDNTRQTTQGMIEIMVDQTTFNAIVDHPSIRAMYQQAYAGRGQEYLDKAVAPFGKVARGKYGFVSSFEYGGVVFIVAPQKYVFSESEDISEEVDAVEAGKGFAIVHGIRGAFKMVYGQNNSLTDNTLAKVYAYRSPIISDAYFEITASSSPMAYTTVPELCYEFTFKTA